MANQDELPIERTVKEFGNGAHVTIPRTYLGETVEIRPASATEPGLQPPIQRSDLSDIFTSRTAEDLRFESADGHSFPREGTYLFEPDLRLKIDVELVREDQSAYLMNLEDGRITYVVEAEDPEELYSDRDNPPTEAVYLVDELVPVLGTPHVAGGDWYRYTVKWNKGRIYSAVFTTQGASKGVFYIPHFSDYDSLEAYRDSLEYELATFLSDAPTDHYDQYLDALNLTSEEFGSRIRSNTDRSEDNEYELSNEEIYARCTAFEA